MFTFFYYAPQEISTAYREVADAFPDKKRQSSVLGKQAYREGQILLIP